jgi:hypothetical protein
MIMILVFDYSGLVSCHLNVNIDIIIYIDLV